MINVYERQNPYPQILSELYRIAAGRNQRKEELAASQAEAKANRDFQEGMREADRKFYENQQKLGFEEAARIREDDLTRLRAENDRMIEAMRIQMAPVAEQVRQQGEELQAGREWRTRVGRALIGDERYSGLPDYMRPESSLGILNASRDSSTPRVDIPVPEDVRVEAARLGVRIPSVVSPEDAAMYASELDKIPGGAGRRFLDILTPFFYETPSIGPKTSTAIGELRGLARLGESQAIEAGRADNKSRDLETLNALMMLR